MAEEDDRRRPEVTIGDDGRRRVSWPISTTAEKMVNFQHDFPDAVQHHYLPLGMNEEVPLYKGTFHLGDNRPFDGDVRFRWHPTPRVEAKGTRPSTTGDLLALLSERDQNLWAEGSTVRIELDGGCLPRQPDTTAEPSSQKGYSVSARIEQEVGCPDDLEHVTFLLPNGWRSHDSRGVCDPDDLQRLWRGRTEASGAGWTLTFDRSADMEAAAWRELKDTGGFRFTHVGRLVHTDRRPFTGREAFNALDRVRVALSIALGRRTTCSLPVGWRAGRPVWTLWRGAPVDPYVDKSPWLDDTIASQQVSEIVSRVLKFSAHTDAWEALRPAVAYYVAANVDVDVELSVAIPVSGLQLLAYYRFVTERQAYSQRRWKALETGPQLRLLLNDVAADLAVHPHFAHLTKVRDRLAVKAAPRDTLGVVVKMRNVVTHPTRDKPAGFSTYEWAEAGMHARYWLCLSILHLVGYQGQI